MMSKMVLGIIFSFLSIAVVAQRSTPAPTTFGITGGVNWNNINGKAVNGSELENKLRTGFNAGLNVEIPIGSSFYVQPGVEYRVKGSEMNNGDRLTLSYIDVPVNLVYKPTLGQGKVLLGFGPYVGLGVDGNVKSGGIKRDVTFTNSYSPSEAADIQFKRLDAGANFMAGYEFRNKISASIKAQLGLVNINPETDVPNDETRYRNTGFGLSLGYRF